MSANAAFARFNPTPTRLDQMAMRAGKAMSAFAYDLWMNGHPDFKGTGLAALVPDSAIAHGTNHATCQVSDPANDRVTLRTVTKAVSDLPNSRAVDCPNSPDGRHACQACQMAGASFCIRAARLR